jgi:serine protease Do
MTVQVTVQQRPTEEELARQLGVDQDQGATPQGGDQPVPAEATLGLSLQPLTPQITRALQLPADARGVVITAVDPNSDAAQKELQRGDLIVTINGKAVATPAEVRTEVDNARRAGRKSVLLLIRRGNLPPRYIGLDIAPPR